jgi:GDP-L-fucose synthase
MMEKTDRIFVAGHTGMVGGAICRMLKAHGYSPITVERADLDLRGADAVSEWFDARRPQYVFLAAATVGGIHDNATRPAEFIYDNLSIQANVIHAAWRSCAKRLMFFGSSCIYPRDCQQPIKEESLMTGPLEATNSAYAMAKIAGIEMLRAYRKQHGMNSIAVMPCNLYGPGDNYDSARSHVMAALIRKCHEAKDSGAKFITVWGSGKPWREFMHVDDLAEAVVVLMNGDVKDLINVGTGYDLRISELAVHVAAVVGFAGQIAYDTTMPDGTPRKVLDVTKSREHWKPRIGLLDGIASAYEDYKKRLDEFETRLQAEVCG